MTYDPIDTGPNDNDADRGVTIGQASIGTVDGQGKTFRLVDRATAFSSNEVSFTGLSSDTEYRLFYTLFHGATSAEDLILRFNGDGATTGNYSYWDETGTKQTGENHIQLVDFGNQTSVSGAVVFSEQRFGNDGHPTGANHQFEGARDISRINGFATVGQREVTEALSSVQLRAAGGATNPVVELWERDFA